MVINYNKIEEELNITKSIVTEKEMKIANMQHEVRRLKEDVILFKKI